MPVSVSFSKVARRRILEWPESIQSSCVSKMLQDYNITGTTFLCFHVQDR